MKRFGTILLAVFILMTSGSLAQQEKTVFKATSKDTDKGVEMAKTLITLRGKLAKDNLKPKAVITEETVKKVCIAVAARAKEFVEKNKAGEKNIYILKFVSERPRNPANAADDDEKRVLRLFEESEKRENWHGVDIDDNQYYRYMKPIYAEKPCLSCHGDRKKIPAFIKKTYTDDSSYDFKEGDLMGAVAVFTWKGF